MNVATVTPRTAAPSVAATATPLLAKAASWTVAVLLAVVVLGVTAAPTWSASVSVITVVTV